MDHEVDGVLRCALFLELHPDGTITVEHLEPEGQGIPDDELIRGLNEKAGRLWAKAEASKATV